MSEQSNKRQKTHQGYKKNFNYNHNSRKKLFLAPGVGPGFIVTCNFREKDCIRDAYKILNDYADKVFPTDESSEAQASVVEENTNPKGGGGSDNDEEEEDISKLVEKEVEATKSILDNRKNRFQQVDTGGQNCLFIKATVPDVVKLAESIVRDLAETKQAKTRNILRLLPVEAICKANLNDIMDTAGKLFDKHFLREPKTFAIVFNRRLNNSVGREEVIKELADMITAKNIQNKVDLKHAEATVLIEVIKGHCCLGVLPDYFKLKKYNLTELVLAEESSSAKTEGAPPKEEQNEVE